MGGQNVKNTIVDKMLEFVAPHLCSGCGEIGSTLCDRCKYSIIKSSFTACVLCLETEPRGICEKHQLSYRNAWVVGYRNGTLQSLIDGFKFQHMKAAARSLGELLNERLPILASSTIVIPIPTSPAHIRERGYDHMQLIAEQFGALRQLSVTRILGRGNTATQHVANRQKRREQARSAFVLTSPVDPDIHYLLLDDIITTGSTIEQASAVLARAGARFISVGALARQPLD